MKSFQGRVVVPGTVSAEALVSHGGFNTLASFQMALQFGDLKALGKGYRSTVRGSEQPRSL